MGDLRLLRTLCWTLVVAAIVSAVFQLMLAANLWAGGPTPVDPNADLIDKLLVFRADDIEVFPAVLLSGLAGVVVFLVVGLIGVAIRPLADGTTGRDVMATVLVSAAVVGIVAQALNVAVAQAATFGYCDCGYKAQELISQDYALSVGRVAQTLLGNVAVALVGVGALAAGRLVRISPTWRFLSYAIALLLLFATVLRLLPGVLTLEIDVFQIADLVAGLTLAILVPIWAILLARGAGEAQQPETA
jgi:hypothetical protein